MQISNPIEFQQELGTVAKGVKTYRVIQPIDYRGRKWKPGKTVKLHLPTAKKYLAAGKLITLPRPRFQDIFQTEVKFPERVVILGSGPKGVSEWDRITDDDFVIALNGAITCDVPHINVWGAMDPTLHTQKYFQDLMLEHYREYYLKGYDLSPQAVGNKYPIPIMEKERVARWFPWVQCVFNLIRPAMMKPNNIFPHKGYLRPGCTVAGAFVQLAYWRGTKEVVLCGIDMFGDKYHDGSKHKQRKRAGAAWGVVGIFNEMMRHLEKEGMRFQTLSETQLDLEKI